LCSGAKLERAQMNGVCSRLQSCMLLLLSSSNYVVERTYCLQNCRPERPAARSLPRRAANFVSFKSGIYFLQTDLARAFPWIGCGID
jgi:hypothetical protein